MAVAKPDELQPRSSLLTTSTGGAEEEEAVTRAYRPRDGRVVRVGGGVAGRPRGAAERRGE